MCSTLVSCNSTLVSCLFLLVSCNFTLVSCLFLFVSCNSILEVCGAVRGVTMGRVFLEWASLAHACPHVGVYIDPL